MGLIKLTRDYSQMPNDLLNSEKLSLKSKGLWIFINSKPEGWDFSVKRISKQTKDGEESVKSGVKELEKWGLLKRTVAKTAKGRFSGFDYELRDFFTISDLSVSVKSPKGEPPKHSNTDNSNTDLSKKEEDKADVEKTSSENSFDSKNNHKNIIETYHLWFQKKYGSKPVINGGKDGQAVKKMVKHFILSKKDPVTEFNMILHYWPKYSPYIQQKNSLNDIYTNLNQIYSQISKIRSKRIDIEKKLNQGVIF